MKITRQYCDQEALTLGSIKHVHPFRFLEGFSLGCDPARIYIKVYPCGGMQVIADEAEAGERNIGSRCSKQSLVIDLEQGVIKAVSKSHRIIELEAELNVKGPVEPRRLPQ